MVRAAVTERKLERLVTGGEREELVSEADAEDRHAADQLAYDRHLLLERLGIARAVRQEHARRSGAARPPSHRAETPSPPRPRRRAAAGSSACSRSRRRRLACDRRRNTRTGVRSRPRARAPVRTSTAARAPPRLPARPTRRRRPQRPAEPRQSRSLRTSERVSIPLSATMPRSWSQSVHAGPRASRIKTARVCAWSTRSGPRRRRSCRPSAP